MSKFFTLIISRMSKKYRLFSQYYFLASGSQVSFDNAIFTPQPLRAVGYCFHPWCPDGRASGRVGGQAAGNSLFGLYLRNRKMYVVDTW